MIVAKMLPSRVYSKRSFWFSAWTAFFLDEKRKLRVDMTDEIAEAFKKIGDERTPRQGKHRRGDKSSPNTKHCFWEKVNGIEFAWKISLSIALHCFSLLFFSIQIPALLIRWKIVFQSHSILQFGNFQGPKVSRWVEKDVTKWAIKKWKVFSVDA